MTNVCVRTGRLAGLLCAAVVLATAANAATVVIDVGEDTAPYSFLPSLPRYNNPSLYAFMTEDAQQVAHDFETYVWFDVDPADVPAGEIVTEAYVLVTYGFDYTAFGDTSDEPGTVDCHEVVDDWNQTTLTWLNRPAIDPPFDTVTGILAFGSIVCDATAVVQGWLYGGRPNHGVALTSPSARVMGMYSYEASVDPALMPNLVLVTELPEPAVASGLAACVAALVGFERRRGRARAQGQR